MKDKVILGMDLGTTGNRVVAYNRQGGAIAKAYYEFPQIFPKPGWVEHDPLKIWETALKALKEVGEQVGAENIEALGITNQRETTILWEKSTGKPVFNAIVWQCRRTAPLCESLKEHAERIKEKTGLFLDAYFSATKISWILEHVPGLRARAERGEILFGTVDTWILWMLTGGRTHATEVSNASRTLLYNIRTLEFDSELLKLFHVPKALLPAVLDSDGDFGCVEQKILGREIPVRAMLGDQQASLFGQGAWEPGIVKNTYGTGLFVMTNTGDQLPRSGRLVNTIAWKTGKELAYAVEGSIFIGGSCIQWLRDILKLIPSAEASEALAAHLASNDGVYLVPAFVGLGAPYWDPDARGLLIGITRGTTPAHIVRASLEALAYQTRDVIEEMQKLCPGRPLRKLRVDGGAVKNNFLMQFQADILGCSVERPLHTETTVFGVAGLTGIAVGFWSRKDYLQLVQITERTFEARMDSKIRDACYRTWKEAVARSRGWAALGA